MSGSNRKIIILRWLLGSMIILWCALIFSMSSETAVVSSDRSMGLVGRIIGTFVSFFGGDAEDAALIDMLEFYVRKAAHMFIFFVLSVLVFSFLSCYDLKRIARSAGTLVFCLLYCISDEIHQLFVEGRSGNLFDVCIDMVGVTIGLVFSLLVLYIYRKFIHKENYIHPSGI